MLPWSFGPKDALGFAVRTVTELLDRDIVPAKARALDLGCAVGRSCYELSTVAEKVTGIDYSLAFVQAAETVRLDGRMAYVRHDEASASTELVALRPKHGHEDCILF